MVTSRWACAVRMLAALLLVLTLPAPAATYTWDGGTGANQLWSNADNWDAAGAPVSASTTTVVFAGTSNLANLNQNIASPFVLNRLATTSTAQNQAVSIAGSPLQFVADGATQPTLAHSRAQNLTVVNAIQVPGSTTLGLSNSTWQVYLDGAITGDGSVRFTTAGGGELNFRNTANAFTGGLSYVNTAGTNAQWGRLKVNAGCLGSSTVTLNGGNIEAATSAQPGGLILYGTATYANDFVLAGTSPIFAGEAFSGSASITLNGTISGGANGLYLRGNGGTSTINGAITAGSLTKLDAATWVLSNASNSLGPVSVMAGMLRVTNAGALGDAASDTSVANGAALELSGNLTIAEPITVSGDGISYNGAVHNVSGNTTVLSGPVTVTGGYARLAGLGTSLTLTGGVTGGNLRLQGNVNVTTTPISLSSKLSTNAGTTTLSIGGNAWNELVVDWAGTFKTGAANVLPSGGIVTLGDSTGTANTVGTLDLSGFSQTVAGLRTGSPNTSAGSCELKNSGSAATLTLDESADFDFAGKLSGPVALVKQGAGTQALTGANTYTGATTLTAGILSANTMANGGAASSIGASTNAAANLVFNGGTLQYTGPSVSTDRDFTINSAQSARIEVSDPATVLTFVDVPGCSLPGNGSIVKTGPGTLVLGRTSGSPYLTTINSISVLDGTLSSGGLQINVSNTAGTAITLANGATLDFPAPLANQGNGVTQRLWVQAAATTATISRGITLCGSPAGTGGSVKLFDVEDGAADVDLLVTAGFSPYPAGSVANLTKAGAGTMSITAGSTHFGTTTVQAGTLLVNNTGGSATGSGPVVVAGGMFGGNGSVSGTVTVDGGVISAGNSPGHLTLGSDYVQNAGGTMLVELGGAQQGVGYDWIEVVDQATLAGTLDIDWYDGFWSHGPFIVLTAANGITNADLSGLRIDDADASYGEHEWRASIVDLGGKAQGLQLELVPEPLTLLALGASLAGLGGYVRRRRR